MNSQCQSLYKMDFTFSPNRYVKANVLTFSGERKDKALEVIITQVDFVKRLSVANTLEAFNKKILSILSEFGFTDYALVCKTAVNSIDSPHSSLPPALFKEYQRGKYCRFDMVLDYINQGQQRPILLSTIAQIIETSPLLTYSFDRNLEILALYKKYNIHDAYVIPVNSQKGSGYGRAVFSVMAGDVDSDKFLSMTANCGELLKLLADAVNFVSQTKFSPSKQAESIKVKPLRLLNTMAMHDLSLAEAADSLCISLDTANKHMALAKQALGTNSQANAIYLAISKGLINV